MIRRMFLAAIATLWFAPLAWSQTVPAQFHWQAGQVFTYRVEQTMQASDTSGKSTDSTATKLNLVKRWRVLSVDAGGVATLEMSIDSLRNEITRPNGEVLLFDSEKAANNEPHLHKEMIEYVGKPLIVLRLDGKGKLVEVKTCKFGSINNLECDLPFKIILPGDSLQAGQSWERNYQISLDRSQAENPNYDAVQKYTCKSISAGVATITLATTVKSPSPTARDQVPLLQKQPVGEAIFDLTSGMLRSARLEIDKEVVGHQGEGSRYHLQSSYREEYVGNK